MKPSNDSFYKADFFIRVRVGPIDFDLMVFSLREVIKNAALFFVSCVTPAFMLLEIEFFPLILLNLVPPFDSCGRIFCPKKDT